MARSRRLFILAAMNCLFWLGMCYISWNRLIPERLIAASVFLSLIFSIPFGLCSLPFLVVAEGHDTGWRIAVYGSLTFANSIAWAWVIDGAWRRLMDKPAPRGFPVVGPDEKRNG